MVIKSIELENFLCYYDSNTPFEFGDGPTIIIGQNRTGKSKLFDAINWAFYDKAYNTDFEKWDVTKDWKDKLVNDYAKAQCKIGGNVRTSVTIKFEDEYANLYTLNREFKIKKKTATEWDIPRNTIVNLKKKDNISNNSSESWDIEAQDLIKSIFPENLSTYFLFQGENISQIMSLNNKSAFTKALTDLSRIEIFEKAKNYAKNVYKLLKREFDDKEDKDGELQGRKITLSSEIDQIKKDIDFEKEELENNIKEREIAKDVFDNKNDELKKYEECAKIINDIKDLESQKDTKADFRRTLVENQKKDIFEKWMYQGTDQILKNFNKIYDKSKVDKKIPEPIRQEFIKEMIKKHKCLVCGRDAEEDSPEFKRIQTLLNEKSLDKETELINKLSFVAENMLEKTSNIKSEIQQFYLKISEIDDQIRNFNQRIKSKNDELKNVKPSDVSEDEIKLRNFTQLQKDRDDANIHLSKCNDKITGSKSKLEYINKQLVDKEKEYDSLVENSSNIKEKDRLQLAEKIEITVNLFYENFLARLISDIEMEANTCFIKMTEKNSSLSGKVKVDYDLKEVYTIDESGNRLFNINQANKVSLQISFVAAVLSVSNKFWNTYFPFIADAPISALGGNNKITAVNTMMDIFKQSVIILKDDAVTSDPESIRNDLVRNLILKNDKIHFAYELKMQGINLEEQHTKIVKLK